MDTFDDALARAFPARPLPPVTLRQALALETSATREVPATDWAAARRADGHLAWSEIADADLVACRDGVAHLDPESFAYYLGALLRFAARHAAAELWTPEGKLVETVMFSLTERSAYNLARLDALTPAQAGCAVDLLLHVAEAAPLHGHDAEAAIERYWRGRTDLG